MGQSESDKVLSRLSVMYGPCKQLSDTTALANINGTFTLFKLSTSGAKVIAAGQKLQFYSSDKRLVLGDKYMGCYGFNGETIIDPIYTNIQKLYGDRFETLLDITTNTFGILDLDGKILVNNECVFTRSYTNGVTELVRAHGTELIADGNSLDASSRDVIAVYSNLVAIRRHGVAWVEVYDPGLHTLGKVAGEQYKEVGGNLVWGTHANQKIQLTTGVTVNSGTREAPFIDIEHSYKRKTWAQILETDG